MIRSSARVLALVIAAVSLIPALPVSAADWPQWRGVDRTGVSPETGWSAVGRERPLWTKPLGFGHSSFAVANGRLYAMGHDAERGLDVVYCLDPLTGEEQWTHTYPAAIWNEGHDGGTCTTPAVADGFVYTSNREGKLFALRADTGSVVWTRDFQADLGVTPPRWGFSGSPVVVQDLVVVNAGKLAAYDRATGALRWSTERDYGNAYSTPIDAVVKRVQCMLVLNGLGLAAIDLRDGTETRFHAWTRNPERSIYGATPILVDRASIFISAASGGGCLMLEPDDEDGFEVIWESRVMRNDQAGCVLYEGHLYGFDGSILKCIDIHGKEKWRQRGIGLGAMSVVGGRLLVLGAKGELIVAEATPEQYVELSRTTVLEGGAYWSTPVLSDGLVFARNSLGDMVCRDHRGGDVVATRSHELPVELPPASSLLDRHVAAIGGADAIRGLTTFALDGRGELHGSGPIERCDAQLTWSATRGFVWRFASGLDFGYTTDAGWSMSQGGPQVLNEEQIAGLRELVDMRTMLAADWGYAELETAKARVFDDRSCYVVEGRTPAGEKRTLYFEVESGLMAGRAAEGKPLWIFDDYASVGGVLIPMEWSFFEPERGAMTLARFSQAATDTADGARFDPPVLIQMMSWSDARKAEENERLRARHAALVGSYALASGSMVGTPITISIDEGGLRMAFGPQPPDFITEPDDEGRLFSMSNRQIWLTLTPRDAGEPALVLWAYGDEFGRLERR